MQSTCVGCGLVGQWRVLNNEEYLLPRLWSWGGGGDWGMAIEQFVTKWVERVTITALYSVTCNLKYVWLTREFKFHFQYVGSKLEAWEVNWTWSVFSHELVQNRNLNCVPDPFPECGMGSDHETTNIMEFMLVTVYIIPPPPQVGCFHLIVSNWGLHLQYPH